MACITVASQVFRATLTPVNFTFLNVSAGIVTYYSNTVILTQMKLSSFALRRLVRRQVQGATGRITWVGVSRMLLHLPICERFLVGVNEKDLIDLIKSIFDQT